MNVAEYADLLGERERENFSRMPAAVQYQLAAPSVPDSVREQVLEASASGRPFKVAEVKEMVRAAKPKMEPQAASLEVDSGSNSNTKNEDKPEKRAEAVSAKEDVISSVLETHLVSSQAASESSKAPEIQRPARAILQSKLDATTDDARRQAIIKDIFVLVNKMSTSERVTLISNLNKLADITSKQLAECLQ